jgi:glycosyltransferase involved in cell wall biosynthesis
VERSDEGFVLSAGRLVWEKGHQDVLRAVAALRQGIGVPPRPDIRLLIVGDGPEGKRLRAYADELGLAGAVEFRATVPYDEMPALYAGASALVLASLPSKAWEEQFGMVLIEAMASGTPVVAADRGALPETCGGAALLVDPENGDELAEAVLAAATDDATRARLVAAGRERAAQLTWRRAARSTDELLSGLL